MDKTHLWSPKRAIEISLSLQNCAPCSSAETALSIKAFSSILTSGTSSLMPCGVK